MTSQIVDKAIESAQYGGKLYRHVQGENALILDNAQWLWRFEDDALNVAKAAYKHHVSEGVFCYKLESSSVFSLVGENEAAPSSIWDGTDFEPLPTPSPVPTATPTPTLEPTPHPHRRTIHT